MAKIEGEGKKRKTEERKRERAAGREGGSGREYAEGLWGCSHWPQTGAGV